MKAPIIAALASLALSLPSHAGPIADGATAFLIASNYCELSISDEELGAVLYAAAGEIGVSIDEAISTVAALAAAQGNQLRKTGAIDTFCADMASILPSKETDE